MVGGEKKNEAEEEFVRSGVSYLNIFVHFGIIRWATEDANEKDCRITNGSRDKHCWISGVCRGTKVSREKNVETPKKNNEKSSEKNWG